MFFDIFTIRLVCYKVKWYNFIIINNFLECNRIDGVYDN